MEINPDQTYAWNCTRMGGWAVAHTPFLRTAITIKRLKIKAYVNLIRILQSISLIVEPPYTVCPEYRED
ncbi:hypothetical protein [Sinomicrobium sp.]